MGHAELLEISFVGLKASFFFENLFWEILGDVNTFNLVSQKIRKINPKFNYICILHTAHAKCLDNFYLITLLLPGICI